MVTTHLENLEKSENYKVVKEKSGEVKSGVFFQALNTPKLVFWHPIPFLQLLQPQLLNNRLSGLTLFFINMKQRLLTISVNTRHRVIFACLYWKSQGISCGLESGHPVVQSPISPMHC